MSIAQPANITAMQVGERIREARRSRGMSQRALQRASGVHFTRISSYENGHTRPNLESAAKIANALGVPLGDLVQ